MTHGQIWARCRGYVRIFGGTARAVLDEPFVPKATFNYSRKKDPSLVSATERAMLHSDNAALGQCLSTRQHVGGACFRRDVQEWIIVFVASVDQLFSSGSAQWRRDDCWIRQTTVKTSRVAQKPHHTAIYEGARRERIQGG